MKKPKQVWLVLDGVGSPALYMTRKAAREAAKEWRRTWPEDGPYLVVKYVLAEGAK